VAKRTEAVNVPSQEVRRLERLVGDMLSVAQIESGTVRLNTGDVRLEPIFEEMKSDFAEQARQKEIKLRFDLPPKWPRLEGDRDKIVMALHNLVGNAIKYTPAGGEVVVRANTDEKTFACEVIDSRIGIKDEEQTLVFEKFYRAKDKRIVGITGTGLGLAIAREVVRLHGGDISLKSVIDKGSTFTMTLPAKAA
jgi:signal transduction histidine kinase